MTLTLVVCTRIFAGHLVLQWSVWILEIRSLDRQTERLDKQVTYLYTYLMGSRLLGKWPFSMPTKLTRWELMRFKMIRWIKWLASNWTLVVYLGNTSAIFLKLQPWPDKRRSRNLHLYAYPRTWLRLGVIEFRRDKNEKQVWLFDEMWYPFVRPEWPVSTPTKSMDGVWIRSEWIKISCTRCKFT